MTVEKLLSLDYSFPYRSGKSVSLRKTRKGFKVWVRFYQTALDVQYVYGEHSEEPEPYLYNVDDTVSGWVKSDLSEADFVTLLQKHGFEVQL